MNLRRTLVAAVVTSAAAVASVASPCRYDAASLVAGKGWTVVNRNVSWTDADHKSVHLDDGRGAGVAWLDGCSFDTGTIELDVRGRDVAQKSFVGIAFHGGTADDNYEGIYFRPFNFAATDPEKHAHAVQYIAEPEYGWKRLRAEHPGMYENAITPAVAGDAWFHAKVVVSSDRVRVFVNGASDPTLDVPRISKQSGGRVGLWVGDESDGTFANLTVTPRR